MASGRWNRGYRGAMDALATAVEEPWVDVLLVRLNHAGACMDGPREQVLPLVRRAHETGKGILAMKILGRGELASDPARVIRFVMETGCVHAFTVSRLRGEEGGPQPLASRRHSRS